MSGAVREPATATGTRDSGLLWTVTYLALLALAVAAVALPPVPHLQDYGEWIYQAVVIDRMLEGDPGPFTFRDYPVPNAIIQALGVALLQVVDPTTMSKLILVLYLAATGLVFASLRAIALRSNAAPAMVIAFSILIGSQFFNGYLNNMFGNLLLMLYFAILLRREPKVWETFVFAMAIFFCHATSFACFCFLVGVHVFWRRIHWAHIAAGVPAGLMFIWYSLRKDEYVESGLELRGFSDWFQYKIYSVTKFGPYHNFFFDMNGDAVNSPALYWGGVAVNLAFGAFLAFLIARVFLRDRFAWIKNPAYVSVFALLAAFPLMPSTISGVVNIGERFLTPAVLLLVMLAASLHLRWTLRIGAGLAAMIAVSLVLFLGGALRHDVATAAPEISSAVTAETRFERLYWHRPLSNLKRDQDIVTVREQGLENAPPLDFTTSLIGDDRARAGSPASE